MDAEQLHRSAARCDGLIRLAGGLARALERLDLDAHIARLRTTHEARAARMLDALARHAPSWTFDEPEGGFSVHVTTPESA